MEMVLLGAHESAAGGLYKAFERIQEVGGKSLQIFTRNQRQWRAAPLAEEEIHTFREAWEQAEWMPVASHASYLINLGTSDKEKGNKSADALAEELRRCKQLGIRFVVLHPGSHGGAGVEKGLNNVVGYLDTALEAAGCRGGETMVLLETTAGQGTGLGSRFEELAWIREYSKYPEQLGICVDTCHIFAAGYDIRTAAGYLETFEALDRHVGLEHVHFFHLNDSKKECGSKVDRHEHIGQGEIGLEGFRLLLNDTRFSSLPMTLETPKGKDLREDKDNLKRLRALLNPE